MERRYEVFAEKGVRNITAYKERKDGDDENLPYIVAVSYTHLRAHET